MRYTQGKQLRRARARVGRPGSRGAAPPTKAGARTPIGAPSLIASRTSTDRGPVHSLLDCQRGRDRRGQVGRSCQPHKPQSGLVNFGQDGDADPHPARRSLALGSARSLDRRNDARTAPGANCRERQLAPCGPGASSPGQSVVVGGSPAVRHKCQVRGTFCTPITRSQVQLDRRSQT